MSEQKSQLNEIPRHNATFQPTLSALVQDPSPSRLIVAKPAEALADYSNQAIQIRHSKDVHIFSVMGQRYVMKFQRPAERSRIRAWASSALCGALFGTLPSPKRLMPGGIRHEARRLRSLRRQGVRVPNVHLVTDDHLILEHTGQSVEEILKDLPNDDRRTQLVGAIVNDLIEFHRAGHWHGGAQVRNLTLKNNTIYRIDFEEQIGAAFPLPFAQAFDVLLAFNSLIDFIHEDRKKTGTKLLLHYLHHTSSADVIQTLTRLDHWLKNLRRIEPFLNRHFESNRDLQRTYTFARILNGALKSYQPAHHRHITL